MTRPAAHTFTGGPNQLEEGVGAALAGRHGNHLDPAFAEEFRRLEDNARRILGTAGDIVVVQAEGVVGLEAAARSLVGPGTRCLNLVSGVFGETMGTLLRELGADVRELTVPANEAVDPGAVEQALREHPGTDVVSVCHVETPSGTINPLAAIAEAAHRHGALVFVDVVASVGADDVRVDDWGLDLAVGAPHKCLGGPPGLSLVTVSQAAWRRIETNPAAPARSVLSLLEWRDGWLRAGRFPFTPSVSDVIGSNAACAAVLSEGLDRTIERHQRAARATRAGATAMGLHLWPASEAVAAGAVTAIRLPAGISAAALVEHIRARYDILLSTSYVSEQVIRVGHMGSGSRSIDIVLALSGLGRGLLDLGARVSPGTGLEAALAEYAAGPGGA